MPNVKRLLGLLLVLSALTGFGFAGWGLWLGQQSLRWPTVPGTVVHYEIVKVETPRRPVRYLVRVEYAYVIAGHLRTGTDLSIGPDALTFHSEDAARQATTSLTAGSAVTVSYDPRWAGAHAVLFPGMQGSLVQLAMAAIVSGFMLLTGVLLLSGWTLPEKPPLSRH